MKKSLIALAVLAASGATMAQSTVTLYGVGDIYLGSSKSTTGAGVSTTNTVLDSGGFNGSRWGVKGSEDLGGGLKANFQFESGFDLSTGASQQGGLLFGRQAYVGFSGGFGAVNMGRQYTAYDSLRGATDHVYDSSFAVQGGAWGGGAVADYTGRNNNAIRFDSASFGGLSGAIMYSLGEDKTATASASSTTSFHVKYANGPILAGLAYQSESPVGGAAKTNYTLLAGTYDFGVASIQAGYNTAKKDTAKDKEFQVGVMVPLSGAASVGVGYAQSKGEVAGVTTAKAKGFGLAAAYDLSKRTRLYAGFNQVKKEDGAGASTGKTQLLAFGVRHAF